MDVELLRLSITEHDHDQYVCGATDALQMDRRKVEQIQQAMDSLDNGRAGASRGHSQHVNGKRPRIKRMRPAGEQCNIEEPVPKCLRKSK